MDLCDYSHVCGGIRKPRSFSLTPDYVNTSLIIELINLDRYPVNDLESPAGKLLIERIRADLGRDGAASLPGFLRPAALNMMVKEAEELAPLAYPGPTEVSPYFFNYDVLVNEIGPDHPTRFKGARRLAQVAYDLFPRDSLIRRLYHSDLVTDVTRSIRHKWGVWRLRHGRTVLVVDPPFAGHLH